MTFFLDENISGDTELFLRAAGHEVLRCTSSSTDPVVFARAESERALLLTRDHDFLAFQPSSSGIIYVRIHPSIAEHITQAVRHLLTSAAESLYGRVVIVRRSGYEFI